MMIRIKPETIYALRDSTGHALTELMDELIRHSVSVSGVAQAFVSTNLRVNYQHGGVDTQVASSLPVDKRDPSTKTVPNASLKLKRALETRTGSR